MKKLKIVAKGWEGYTGYVGLVKFTDGVSDEPVPRTLADRVSANVVCVEVDEDGTELGQANPAARLIGGATIPAQVLEPLPTATEEELAEERARIAAQAKRPAVDKFYSVKELEKVVDEKGIKGLREIGNAWHVRGRAIPELIKAIMEAQGAYEKRVADAEAAEEAERQAAIEKAKAENAAHESEVSANGRVLAPEQETAPASEPAKTTEPAKTSEPASKPAKGAKKAKAKEPAVEKPKSDEPKSDEPKSAEPVSDEAKSEDKGADEASDDVPKAPDEPKPDPDGVDFVEENDEIASTESKE